MKKRLAVMTLMMLMVVSVAGCTVVNSPVGDRTFRNVFITNIEEQPGIYRDQPYVVTFSNGMTIDKMIDENIFQINNASELEYITFTTSEYPSCYEIKDYKYADVRIE